VIRQKINKIIDVRDITLLAKLNAFLLSRDSAEYSGIKEVVNAPSAKNARNRLAKRNEEKNTSARGVAPTTMAINISLISPEILEIAVKKLNVKILLNIAIYHYSRLYSVSIDSSHIKPVLTLRKNYLTTFASPLTIELWVF
jgi:hypothetical protein